MHYTLCKDIKRRSDFRNSFFALANLVFGLSFENWYQQGYWREAYLPYTLFDGNQAVSNVSVNRIATKINGDTKQYIQLGTVMTHPDYREKGLCRRLMEEVLRDFKEQCDGIYLYANNTVLDFYPKFGFEQADEYCFTTAVEPLPGAFVKLNMENPNHAALLEQYYTKGNPFSDRPMLDNFGLLMFYCGSFMKDCVYYSKEFDCIAIASFQDDRMILYELFCNAGQEMKTLFSAAARANTRTVEFGFMPKTRNQCRIQKAVTDDQLFVYSRKENMFRNERMMLPALSHA